MPINQNLRDVIDVAMPLFAGEAEVVRSYFDWTDRTAGTDRKWISHQCFKEFYGSGYGEPEHGILVEWGQLMIEKRPALAQNAGPPGSPWQPSLLFVRRHL